MSLPTVIPPPSPSPENETAHAIRDLMKEKLMGAYYSKLIGSPPTKEQEDLFAARCTIQKDGDTYAAMLEINETLHNFGAYPTEKDARQQVLSTALLLRDYDQGKIEVIRQRLNHEMEKLTPFRETGTGTANVGVTVHPRDSAVNNPLGEATKAPTSVRAKDSTSPPVPVESDVKNPLAAAVKAKAEARAKSDTAIKLGVNIPLASIEPASTINDPLAGSRSVSTEYGDAPIVTSVIVEPDNNPLATVVAPPAAPGAPSATGGASAAASASRPNGDQVMADVSFRQARPPIPEAPTITNNVPQMSSAAMVALERAQAAARLAEDQAPSKIPETAQNPFFAGKPAKPMAKALALPAPLPVFTTNPPAGQDSTKPEPTVKAPGDKVSTTLLASSTVLAKSLSSGFEVATRETEPAKRSVPADATPVATTTTKKPRTTQVNSDYSPAVELRSTTTGLVRVVFETVWHAEKAAQLDKQKIMDVCEKGGGKLEGKYFRFNDKTMTEFEQAAVEDEAKGISINRTIAVVANYYKKPVEMRNASNGHSLKKFGSILLAAAETKVDRHRILQICRDGGGLVDGRFLRFVATGGMVDPDASNRQGATQQTVLQGAGTMETASVWQISDKSIVKTNQPHHKLMSGAPNSTGKPNKPRALPLSSSRTKPTLDITKPTGDSEGDDPNVADYFDLSTLQPVRKKTRPGSRPKKMIELIERRTAKVLVCFRGNTDACRALEMDRKVVADACDSPSVDSLANSFRTFSLRYAHPGVYNAYVFGDHAEDYKKVRKETHAQMLKRFENTYKEEVSSGTIGEGWNHHGMTAQAKQELLQIKQAQELQRQRHTTQQREQHRIPIQPKSTAPLPNPQQLHQEAAVTDERVKMPLLPGSATCLVCQELPPTIVFEPCYHAVLCTACAQVACKSFCPQCRTPIKGRTQPKEAFLVRPRMYSAYSSL